jgi:hypothetical protein
MEIISADLAGSVIREGFSKLSTPAPLNSNQGNFDMPPFREKLLFQGNFAIMPSRRGFCSKNIIFGVFSLGQEVPKTVF